MITAIAIATIKQTLPPTKPRKKMCLYTSLCDKPKTAMQENINPLCGIAENVEEAIAEILCTTSGDTPDAIHDFPNRGIAIPKAPDAEAVTMARNPVITGTCVNTPPGRLLIPPCNNLKPGAEATTLPTPTAAAVKIIGNKELVAPALSVLI